MLMLSVSCCTVGHKKYATLLLSISSPIIDRFSEFFHWHILQTIGEDMDKSKVAHCFWPTL